MARNSESDTAGVKSLEDIREDLECPVCLKTPRTTPIYQCEQGHIHCKTCHPRLPNCPVCRGPIGNTRSLVAEKIISKLPLQCANLENGCQETRPLLDQIIEHEKYCEFRMVKCFYKWCDKTVAFKNLVEHVKTSKHYMRFVESGSIMNRIISANLHYVFLMENFEKEFGEDLKDRQVGVSVVIDDNTGCQVVKVFFIGSPEVANTLKSIISFKSIESDNDFEITFKRSVIAYQDTQSDIAPCVSLHPNILSEIVNNHNMYKMKISIIQKCDDENDEPKRKRRRLEDESTDDESDSDLSYQTLPEGIFSDTSTDTE